MSAVKLYDVAVVGGGLAGLSLSILCAKAGYSVILFEKEKYPFHKVCGEYISLESRGFLERLGLNIDKMNLPLIKDLMVSAPNGKFIRQPLPLGGFGISRFLIDHELSKIAKHSGVYLLESERVNDINFNKDVFTVNTNGSLYQSRVVAGAYGKRSNIDVKWPRSFILKKNNPLNNYIAVKYHVQANLPKDMIALHNFKAGYCGISKIEDDKYCLCYLTTAANLRSAENSIPAMEKKILYKNPWLEKIFSTVTFLPGFPVTISQISFDRKTQVDNHVLMIGDAAGMITPLCGNGMSMALHASSIAFRSIDAFLEGNISRNEMERNYTHEWKRQFSYRLQIGRIIQRFFGKEILTNIFISIVKPFPFLIRKIIRSTHGRPFH